MRDPIGWHLVWLSPSLSAPIDRLALTSKAPPSFPLPTTGVTIGLTNSTGPPVSPSANFSANPLNASTMTQSSTSQSTPGPVPVINTSTCSNIGNSPPTITSNATVALPSVSVPAPPTSTVIHSGLPPSGLGLSVQPTSRTNAGCLVAATVGSKTTLWSVNFPYGSAAPLHIVTLAPGTAGTGGGGGAGGTGGSFGISSFDSSIVSNKMYLCTLTRFSPNAAPGQPGHYAALPRAKQPWPSELVSFVCLGLSYLKYPFVDFNCLSLRARKASHNDYYTVTLIDCSKM